MLPCFPEVGTLAQEVCKGVRMVGCNIAGKQCIGIAADDKQGIGFFFGDGTQQVCQFCCLFFGAGPYRKAEHGGVRQVGVDEGKGEFKGTLLLKIAVLESQMGSMEGLEMHTHPSGKPDVHPSDNHTLLCRTEDKGWFVAQQNLLMEGNKHHHQFAWKAGSKGKTCMQGFHAQIIGCMGTQQSGRKGAEMLS